MKQLFILMLSSVIVLNSSNAQSKKIINDYASLVEALTSIKAAVEQEAIDMKTNWIPISSPNPTDSTKIQIDPLKSQKDSLLIITKVAYTNLYAKVEGVIAAFQVIIKSPRKINDAYRQKIQKSLDSLASRQAAFEKIYVEGTLLLIKGPGFNTVDVNPIVEILRGAVSLYTEIKKIVDDEREKVATAFHNQCSLIKWADLK